MPKTVIIAKQYIEKNADNLEILEFWDTAEEYFIPDSEKQNILEGTNVKKENFAYINRWFEKHNNMHLGDAGQLFLLSELKLELDTRAFKLYKNFNDFLNDVELKMNLDTTLDAGVSNPEAPLRESYALIKLILLRIALSILHNKNGMLEKSKIQNNIFNAFIKSLSNAAINTNLSLSDKLNGEVASKFSLHFLKGIHTWSTKIKSMIEEVSLINHIKDVVESNLFTLMSIQLHTARFLYFRLQRILNIEITTDRRPYFLDEWLTIYLPKTEKEIIKLSGMKKDTSSQTINKNNSGIAVTRERQNQIVMALQELKIKKQSKYLDEKEINHITNLYNALNDISFALEILDFIYSLTEIPDFLPFMMKYINAQELERYIKTYSKQCLIACTDEGLEKTIIYTIINDNKNDFDIKPISFGLFEDENTMEPMSIAIFDILQSLTKCCRSHGCHTLINEQNQFSHSNFIKIYEEQKNSRTIELREKISTISTNGENSYMTEIINSKKSLPTTATNGIFSFNPINATTITDNTNSNNSNKRVNQ